MSEYARKLFCHSYLFILFTNVLLLSAPQFKVYCKMIFVKWKPRKSFFVVLGFISMYFILSLKDTNFLRRNHDVKEPPEPICTVPLFQDPFDESIGSFFKVKKEYSCAGPPSFIDIIEPNILKINRSILNESFNVKLRHCLYFAILRSPNETRRPDDKVIFVQRENSYFNDSVAVSDEFVKIQCVDENLQNFYEDFKALILVKPEVEAKCARVKTTKRKMSVLLLGIDSVSRLNFIRHFPKTRKYLEELDAVELKSVNKVGEGTLDILFPFLTGKRLNTFWKEGKSNFFDDADFIWKKFSAQGYRTNLVEDAPDWGTFNYEKPGFKKPPTDYYFRPFAQALELSSVLKQSTHHCVKSELEFQYVLNWAKMFSKRFKNQLYFQMVHLARLSHNIFNYAGYADSPTFEFLAELNTSGALNNTFVIFYSDHGIRYGDHRNTQIGKIEDLSPFTFLLPPKWFRELHPNLMTVLKRNQVKLTTTFDFHETLMSILHYPNLNPPFRQTNNSSYGVNLFSEIPNSRTCLDAGIPNNLCACDFFEEYSGNTTFKQRFGLVVVQNISTILHAVQSDCHLLTLNEVKSLLTKVGDQSSNNSYYRVVVDVLPSKAMYEAMVRHDKNEDRLSVIGTIERTNLYNNQSHCVHSRMYKPFCYCKDLPLQS